MIAVTLSPKFQVVVPQPIRERLGLKAGERLQVLDFDGRIELIPMRSASQLRGILRGIDTTVERDADRL